MTVNSVPVGVPLGLIGLTSPGRVDGAAMAEDVHEVGAGQPEPVIGATCTEPKTLVPPGTVSVVAQLMYADDWVRSVTYGARVSKALNPEYGVTGNGVSAAPAIMGTASGTTPAMTMTIPPTTRFNIAPCPYSSCETLDWFWGKVQQTMRPKQCRSLPLTTWDVAIGDR